MSYEQAAIRAEADRICHEHGIADPDRCQHIEHAVRHQAFLRAIEPVRKEIAKLYGYRYLKRIVLGERENSVEYEWTVPSVPEVIAQWEELIAAEAKKYGYGPQS